MDGGRVTPGKYRTFSRCVSSARTTASSNDHNRTAWPFVPRSVARAVPQLPAPRTATCVADTPLPAAGVSRLAVGPPSSHLRVLCRDDSSPTRHPTPSPSTRRTSSRQRRRDASAGTLGHRFVGEGRLRASVPSSAAPIRSPPPHEDPPRHIVKPYLRRRGFNGPRTVCYNIYTITTG